MKLVVVESPYAGDVAANEAYARACVQDCLRRGESPYASHLFFTQKGLLDDKNPAERDLGIRAGFAWGAKADLVAIYIDRGISGGMRQGIFNALKNGIPIEARSLNKNASATVILTESDIEEINSGALVNEFDSLSQTANYCVELVEAGISHEEYQHACFVMGELTDMKTAKLIAERRRRNIDDDQ